jgi:hypothetical protein
MSDAPASLSPKEADAALRRIALAWDLDRSDAMALIRSSETDFSAIQWTEERLTRIAYLVALEKALPKLAPRGGISRWIATAKPGPFFGDQSPLRILTGPIRDMATVLQQVRAWTERR